MNTLVEVLNERRVDNLGIVVTNLVGEKTLQKIQNNAELIQKLYKRARIVDVSSDA